jgi:hypothetical protein
VLQLLFLAGKVKREENEQRGSLAVGKEIRRGGLGNVDWQTCKLKIAKELWRLSAVSSSSFYRA